MKIINILKKLILSLYLSLKRFPLAISLSTSATILLIVLIHNNQSFSGDTRDILGRIVMVLALGIPVSLSTRLIFERIEKVSLIAKFAIYLAEAFALIIYYFLLLKGFKMVPVTRYIGLSISFYLAFIFIPYFFKRYGFELYVIKLLTRLFVTVLYSSVLFIGIIAILFTVDKLLGIHFSDKVYQELWLATVGIFAPCYFLAGVPLYKDAVEIDNYPKVLNVLLLYIVMPIITVYTAILYIYFAKIIVLLQWPIGMVAHLVLWYSVVCAIIIFLISPLINKSTWVKTFVFLLPKLILPLIIMMFISIGIRVKAYGVTENRYFVILLGLWALGIMVYLNLARTKRNIILVVSLSLITTLSVVGPWSSYSISKISQNKRLESILAKNDMISQNMIIKPSKEVSTYDKREISQILSYFLRYHKLTEVKYLPKDFKMDQMENVFGFPNSEYYNEYQNNNHFSYSSDIANKPIDIQGYSYMFSIRSFDNVTMNATTGLVIKYYNKNHEIIITSSGKEIYRKSITSFVNQIYEKHGANDKYNMDPSEMTLTDENDSIKVKIIFQNINGYKNEASTETNVSSMDFYVLINPK